MQKSPVAAQSFNEILSQAIFRAKYYQRLMSILIIEIEPQVAAVKNAAVSNDALVKAMMNRINSGLRTVDQLHHIENYKFGIILDEISKFSDVNTIANRILNLLDSGFNFSDHNIPLKTAIGITIYPLDGNNEIDLLANAEIALQKAKQQVGSYYVCFSGDDETKRRNNIVADLNYALRHEQFSLSYQPIFDLKTNHMMGLEALIRWSHPTMGNVSPEAFIPSAEKVGLIIPIGEWVLRTACHQLHQWHMRGFQIPCSFINVSMLQLQQRDFLTVVKKILKDTHIDPTSIGFDITEVSLMKDIEIVNTHLKQLRKMGLRIAIDDFGTGYTSLIYFKKLPVNCLKIDRTFTSGIPDSPKDTAIVTSILSLSKTVGVDVIAEGVETEMQLEFLRNEGCQYGQGFFLSRPLRVEEMTEYLANLK